MKQTLRQETGRGKQREGFIQPGGLENRVPKQEFSLTAFIALMLAMTVGLGEGWGYGSRFGQGWMKWSWHSFCLVSKWGPCLFGGAWAFCSPSVSPVLFYLACWLLSVRTPLLFCFPLFFLHRHKSLRLLVPEVWSVGMTFPFSILDVLYSFHLSIFKCHFPFFLPMGSEMVLVLMSATFLTGIFWWPPQTVTLIHFFG